MTEAKNPYYTNPKDVIGATKVPLHLCTPAGMIYEALGMADGASKYDPYNWRGREVVASVYVAAFLRHLLDWWDREEDAPDSGVPHLGHAKAGLGILIDAMETGNLIDDRPVVGCASRLMEQFRPLLETINKRWRERLEKEKDDG